METLIVTLAFLLAGFILWIQAMYCVRKEDVWYCVDDDKLYDYLKFKTVSLAEKDRFIIENGTKFVKKDDGKYEEVKDDQLVHKR